MAWAAPHVARGFTRDPVRARSNREPACCDRPQANFDGRRRALLVGVTSRRPVGRWHGQRQLHARAGGAFPALTRRSRTRDERGDRHTTSYMVVDATRSTAPPHAPVAAAN